MPAIPDKGRKKPPAGPLFCSLLTAVFFLVSFLVPGSAPGEEPEFHSPWYHPGRTVFARPGETVDLPGTGWEGVGGVRLRSRRGGLVFEVSHRWSGAVLEVELPPDIPPDFFDLEATTGEAGAGPMIHPGAIRVLRNNGPGLRVVHLTDVHYEDTSVKIERFQQAVEAINLIDPDLILCSGDLMTRAKEEEFQRLSRHFATLDSPVFFAPGNHDHGHLDLFLRYFSPDRYYSFDVGDYHFISLDTGGPLGFIHHHRGQGMEPDQLDWLEKDLQAAGGRSIYVFLHYSPVMENDSFSDGRGKFLSLMKNYRVKAVLSGHVHRDAVFDLLGDDQPLSSYGEASIPVVHTTTLSSRRTRGKGHGFRFLVLSPEGIDGSSPFESLSLGSLSVSCEESLEKGPACLINNATGGVIGGVRLDMRLNRAGLPPPPAPLLWEKKLPAGRYLSFVLDLPPGEVLLSPGPPAP